MKIKNDALQYLTTDLIVKERFRTVAGSEKGEPGSRFCKPERFGGARRDRTDDLLLAKQALSQLSYGPAGCARPGLP